MLEYRRLPDFAYPASNAQLFPNNPSAPVFLEVGFGDGRFWAGQHLLEGNVNYVGVEMSGVSVYRALGKLRASGAPHAILTRSSAEFLVRHIIAPQSLARVYVNFPCPWPKSRHEENRLLRQDFFELLSTRLCDGGEVWLTTDSPEYLGFALEEAKKSALFVPRFAEPPAQALQTKYALKWLEQGLKIHHVRFCKDAQSPKVFAAIEGVEVVPHAILTGALPTNDLPKTVLRHTNAVVVLLEAYKRAGRLLVLARVEEQDLAQEVLVAATARSHEGGSEVVVGVEAFGGPLISPGVKLAVGDVTAWLEGQGLQVVKRSY